MNSLIEEKIKELIRFFGDENEGLFRQALTAVAEAQKLSDVEVLKELSEQAEKDMEKSHNLAPNSYGAGMDWGAHHVLNEAITKIR